MILDKTLSRIQSQINELAPALEMFVDESVQPTAKECESLQYMLVKLQENLAVYTFHKKEKELSPNFNLHAKVSSQNKTEVIEEKAPEPVVEIKEEVKDVSVESKILSAMSVGVNDKFRIINELFKQNGGEYNIVVEQINSLPTWNEAELYLNSLKSIYHWNDTSEVTLLFYSLAKKRFN